MSKWIACRGNCGHGVQVDIDIYETYKVVGSCVYHGKETTLSNKIKGVILGVGEKCHDCFPEDNQMVVYFGQENTISVRPIEVSQYCGLIAAFERK